MINSNTLTTAWQEYRATASKRSAWSRGVLAYGDDLVAELAEALSMDWRDADELCNRTMINRALLNGASDWEEYSYGGCSLIRDREIAERLCTPSELKRTRNGDRDPNNSESWLDVQTRALSQAAAKVSRVIERIES